MSVKLTKLINTRYANPYYVFNGNDTSKDLKLGLGTYIFKNISTGAPIAFKIKDLKNIKFYGLSYNLMTYDHTVDVNDKKLQFNNQIVHNIDGHNYYFYAGNVALEVTGNFGYIEGYYVVNYTNSIINIYYQEHKIVFDKSNLNGSNIKNFLEYNELLERSTYMFYYLGNKSNGMEINAYNKETDSNVLYYPYVTNNYNSNFSNYSCINSNGIPNYLPRDLSNQLIGSSWKLINNSKGFDKQSFGYKNNGLQIFGNSFKIPINQNITDSKDIPGDLYENENIPRRKEAFWYKNNINWKEIMRDKNYENVRLEGDNNPFTLTPLGAIGVAVNGIPFYNHFKFTDIINETLEFDNYNDSIVKKSITLSTYSTKQKDLVKEEQFDNYGGTVDINNSYYYNKYPVSLEAQIKLGDVKGTESLMYNKVFNQTGDDNIGDTIYFYSNNNEITYFSINVSNTLLADLEFKFISDEASIEKYINQIKNATEIVGVPGSNNNLGGYLSIKYDPNEMFLNTIKVTGKLQLSNGAQIKEINFEFNTEDAINKYKTYVYLGLNINGNLVRYNTPTLTDGNESFHYLGYLQNIGSTTDNEMKKFINFMKNQGSNCIIDINSRSGSSPNQTGINVSTTADQPSTGTGCTVDYTYINNNIISLTINQNGNGYKVGDRLVVDGTNLSFRVLEVKSLGHSPILGWAFDGYPIYGQIGFTSFADDTLTLLKSSYVNGKYKQDSGDLDLCNGIYRKTPEFPLGIYHYVCTLDTTTLTDYQFPYVLGAFKGIPDINNFILVEETETIDYTIGEDENDSTLTTLDSVDYDIKLRSIKSVNDRFNGNTINNVNISEDENSITIEQGEKPLIKNFTGLDNILDNNFGKESNNYNNNLTKLLNKSNIKFFGDCSKFDFNPITNYVQSTDSLTNGIFTNVNTQINNGDAGFTLNFTVENNAIVESTLKLNSLGETSPAYDQEILVLADGVINSYPKIQIDFLENFFVKLDDKDELQVKKVTGLGSYAIGLCLFADYVKGICYVATNGLCEFRGFTPGVLQNGDDLIINNTGNLEKPSISTNDNDNDKYIVAQYVGIDSNFIKLININIHLVED